MHQRRKHRLWDTDLTPNMTTLEDNTLDMLFQSSVCWWNPLHIHECSIPLLWMSVSVTSSGNEFHGKIRCSFLSMFNKFNTDAVSRPVSAWNIARACHFSDPREAASWMSCRGGTQIICSPCVTTSSLICCLIEWLDEYFWEEAEVNRHNFLHAELKQVGTFLHSCMQSFNEN